MLESLNSNRKIGVTSSSSQPERWKVITEYANQKADETGMSQEFIEKVFKAIHEESIEVQNKI